MGSESDWYWVLGKTYEPAHAWVKGATRSLCGKFDTKYGQQIGAAGNVGSDDQCDACVVAMQQNHPSTQQQHQQVGEQQ